MNKDYSKIAQKKKEAYFKLKKKEEYFKLKKFYEKPAMESFTELAIKRVHNQLEELHETKEEILKAFVAKYECMPEEIEIVEICTCDGLIWSVRKKAENE